jgi:transcriptional regulator with XRE-family HTH domain
MPSTRDLIRRAVSIELVRRGMKQTDLAERIGMTDTALSNRLTGRVDTDTDDLDRIAEGLGMTVFELIASAQREACTAAPTAQSVTA